MWPVGTRGASSLVKRLRAILKSKIWCRLALHKVGCPVADVQIAMRCDEASRASTLPLT
jgi:hypothetical protein